MHSVKETPKWLVNTKAVKTGRKELLFVASIEIWVKVVLIPWKHRTLWEWLLCGDQLDSISFILRVRKLSPGSSDVPRVACGSINSNVRVRTDYQQTQFHLFLALKRPISDRISGVSAPLEKGSVINPHPHVCWSGIHVKYLFSWVSNMT